MGTIVQLLDEQFGRVLLAIAVVWAILFSAQNGPLTLEPISNADRERPVQVSLNAAKLPAAVKEMYFMPQGVSYALPGDRFIFVPEKKMIVFNPVPLEVPSAGVQPPPQLLPEPGPMLESTGKLARFGDEFPPLKLEAPKQ
jgi:hypothetical protein